MATALTNFDGTGTTNWTLTGTTQHGALSHGTATPDDSEYINHLNGGGDGFLLLEDMPGDFSEVTSISITYRNSRTGKSPDLVGTLRIYKSDESTVLTDSFTMVPQAGFTNHTDSLVLTTGGAVDKTSWDGARLRMQTSGSVGSYLLSEIDINITYSVAGGGGSVLRTESSVLLNFLIS